jgi:hypothetical protein
MKWNDIRLGRPQEIGLYRVIFLCGLKENACFVVSTAYFDINKDVFYPECGNVVDDSTEGFNDRIIAWRILNDDVD